MASPIGIERKEEMKVGVIGAGAVGGLFAARLGSAGCSISMVARGETLRSIRSHGVRLLRNREITSISVHVSDRSADLGQQDVVILAVKGPSLQFVAEIISPLLKQDTIVLTAMNGIPWWFFRGEDECHQSMAIESIDPRGALASMISVNNILGGVVFSNCERLAAGYVKHNFGDRLIVGGANGHLSTIAEAFAGYLMSAGFEVSISNRIRDDIWQKVMGNLTMNPISAITGADCAAILDDELLRDYCRAIMDEVAAIGTAIGCNLRYSVDEYIRETRKIGAFKTSMLQDVENGRDIEIDLLIASVWEIGQKKGVPTPAISGLLGLLRVFGKSNGLYGGCTERNALPLASV